MAARLVCYSGVSVRHLSAAHLKRWAFHFMPKLNRCALGGKAAGEAAGLAGPGKLWLVSRRCKKQVVVASGAGGARPRRLRSAKATCQVVHAKAQGGCPSVGGQRSGEACRLVPGEFSGNWKRRGGRSRSLQRLRRWPAGGGWHRQF